MIGFNLPQNFDISKFSDTERQLWSYILAMQEQMEYWMRNLDKENFNETGLTEITEPITVKVSDLEGNVSELALTSMGLQLDVSNIEGDLTSLSVTVDGMRIADETGSYTVIDGDKLTSYDHDTGAATVIENGEIKVYADLDSFFWIGSIGYEYPGIFSIKNLQSEVPLKILGIGNMSIDATNGTVYIGSSYDYSGQVAIGRDGGRIDLNCDVYYKGVLLTNGV